MSQVSQGRSHEKRVSTVFFGTPDFAVPALRWLATTPDFDLRLVVTQPDRPAGRGRRLTPSPVKTAAEELGLPLYQPASLKSPEQRVPVAEVDVDLFVVAAFGLIFGPKTLALPRVGCVNVHASLLPAYRGASPVTAAIINGDSVAGVSLMLMDAGLDTGPVIANAAIPVGSTETTERLATRLAQLGAELVAEKLTTFARGGIAPVPQPSNGASLTRPLVKADGWLDWQRPAIELERLVRAMWAWPRAWTTVAGEPLQVHRAITVLDEDESRDDPPGTLIRLGHRAAVICGSGCLVLDVVQLPGRSPVSGDAFLAGHQSLIGEQLGSASPPPTPGPLIRPI